ncbi:MAG: hypothetical protein NT165_04020 [Candidatus Falkowbacteria bacterium]|nr:hypothetical protein [Candidatus Falkowbacteria bacterium]
MKKVIRFFIQLQKNKLSIFRFIGRLAIIIGLLNLFAVALMLFSLGVYVFSEYPTTTGDFGPAYIHLGWGLIPLGICSLWSIIFMSYGFESFLGQIALFFQSFCKKAKA